MRCRLWLQLRLCLLAATSATPEGNAADTASKEEASAPHELNGVRHSSLSRAYPEPKKLEIPRRSLSGVDRTSLARASTAAIDPERTFEARDLLDPCQGRRAHLCQGRSARLPATLKTQQEAAMTEEIKSEVISRRRVFSLLGLAASSLVVATIPVSPQVTPHGVELSVDQAQAYTYRRARVTTRRVSRRAYRRGYYY